MAVTLFISSIVGIVILYIVITTLKSILKEQKKTNWLLFEICKQGGKEFTESDKKFLNS